MNLQEFRDLFGASISSLSEEIDEWSGIVHLQAAAFARFTQGAIESGNDALLHRCFRFADRCFGQADSELQNALYVSYLEELELESPAGCRAKTLMPERLLQAWEDIMSYFARDCGAQERRSEIIDV